MPSNPRNFRKEYDNYHSKPEQKKKRASRNAARRKMEREGKVSKGDGKDVSHKNGDANDNRKSNLGVSSKNANRSYPRTASARKKNPKD